MEQPVPVRVYADGVFDLFHFGHARILEQCKRAFPHVWLMVGVNTDADTHRLKGQTVLTYEERVQSVSHCRWVDEMIPDAPWVITKEFLDKHRIDYVAHDGAPYVSEGVEDIYAVPKRLGKFYATQRTPHISTTDVIDRILQRADLYRSRNATKTADLNRDRA